MDMPHPEGLASDVEGLDPRDQMIAALVAAGRTHVQVAEQLGVSTKTVQRVVRRPEVAAEVLVQQREAASVVIGLLQAVAGRAVYAPDGLLGARSEHVRVKAVATALLWSHRLQGEEFSDAALVARVEAVEEVVAVWRERGADGEGPPVECPGS